jgi:hypothetical protein
MSWEREVEELRRREELARRMGGPEGIERQRPHGARGLRGRGAGRPGAAYRREIESAPDPEATGQELIDPRDTRPLLCEFVAEAQRVLQTQLGPPPVPYRP